MGAITTCLQDLLQNGSVEGFVDQMQTRQELYDLLGYVPGKQWYFPNT
jgi:methylisocitrate lyase